MGESGRKSQSDGRERRNHRRHDVLWEEEMSVKKKPPKGFKFSLPYKVPPRIAPKAFGHCTAYVYGLAPLPDTPFKDRKRAAVVNVPIIFTTVPETPEMIVVDKVYAKRLTEAPLSYEALDMKPVKATRIR
jgi:hypothetical protein